MKNTLLLSALFLILHPAVAQNNISPVDSLQRVLTSVSRNDHAERIKILRELYSLYSSGDLPSALGIARQHMLAAERAAMDDQIAEAAGNIGYTLYMQGHNDSALIYLNKALVIFERLRKAGEAAVTKNNIANIFRMTARYDTSLALYNDLLDYYESVKNRPKTAQVLSNIGSLYYTAGNQEKAKEYTLRSLEMQRKEGDARSLAVSLVNLVVFSLNNSEFEEGIKYGDEAISLLKDIDRNYYAAALIRTGYCYYSTGRKEKALEYNRMALDIYKANNNSKGMMEAYRTQGDYLYEMKRYAEAREYGLEALQSADTTNRLDLRLIYDLLKRTAIWLNLPEEAINYSQLQIDMKEADLNDEWASRISEAETKYDTEKKELEIRNLKSHRRIQLILIISLTTLLGTGTVAGFSLFRNQKQSRLLDLQRIRDLEKEKRLTATMALLEGENSERARLSRDLHDGLGGMLSVAKLKISNMKGSLTIPEEHVTSFNTAIDLLDSSIKELRRVAHNLMPEALVKYGLQQALSDFCRSTGKVSCHFYGSDRRLDDKLEIAIYRIVNELVNNALKHSTADSINVQLIVDDSRVSVV
ncbi:MAG: tetratricopeptide repeat protein, partial [Bacteroidales bacterium]|nr:tetratricopeptide repeat protein [Bacteroidales bacterium]